MLEFMNLHARPKMSYWGKGIQGHSLMLLALGGVSDVKNFFFFFFFCKFHPGELLRASCHIDESLQHILSFDNSSKMPLFQNGPIILHCLIYKIYVSNWTFFLL